MSDQQISDPIQRARFWVDVEQHCPRYRIVTKREAATGRISQEAHSFNSWAEQDADQRRESLERGVPWKDVPEDVKAQMIKDAIVTEPSPSHLEPEYPHSRVRYRETERVTLFEDGAEDRQGILGEVALRIDWLVTANYEYYEVHGHDRAYPRHDGNIAWDSLTREDKRHALTELVNWSGLDVKDEERMILNVIDGLPRENWLDGIAQEEPKSDYERSLDDAARSGGNSSRERSGPER